MSGVIFHYKDKCTITHYLLSILNLCNSELLSHNAINTTTIPNNAHFKITARFYLNLDLIIYWNSNAVFLMACIFLKIKISLFMSRKLSSKSVRIWHLVKSCHETTLALLHDQFHMLIVFMKRQKRNSVLNKNIKKRIPVKWVSNLCMCLVIPLIRLIACSKDWV